MSTPNPHTAGQPWQLPAPEPYRGPDPCPACAGRKISGEQVTLTPGRRTLLIDFLCPLCHGCGSSQHLNCQRADHGNHRDENSCCGGRGWFPATAWSTRDPNLAATLRVPCGCSEKLLVAVGGRS